VDDRGEAVPLTTFQRQVARLLAVNRSPDSHLAGGAALHFEPTSKRYSNDLDYFHDSVERVARAFADDEKLLAENGIAVVVEMNQPGYIRARVLKGDEATKIEWSRDSDWRFMPVIEDPACGYRLHPIDVAVNKVLALAGRNEPRDFLDVLSIHRDTLPLGALCWAAAGKDPGFTPLSLLELLRRRGRHQPDDFRRLHLAEEVDPVALKSAWLDALDDADAFIRSRPPAEVGCLYYNTAERRFVAPTPGEPTRAGASVVPHHGRPGGVLPLPPP